MTAFNLSKIRTHFPLLDKRVDGRNIIYFDNGATTQTPNSVVEKTAEYYQQFNANVHRGSHQLSNIATSEFESARVRVQKFIGAKYIHEIIWTKGTTESINLVAHSWGKHNLTHGDEIVLSYAEHHANIVPWQVVAEQTGAVIKVLELNAEGVIDTEKMRGIISSKTKIVCCTHISNVIGKINPIEEVISCAKAVGAKTLIDGAQAIANLPVNVQTLACDFYVFSAHKMYGPTGVGVLYGEKSILESMPVFQSGGEMIKKVSFSGTSFNDLPFKFEPGTPNIAGVVAFAEAIQFIEHYQLNQLSSESYQYKKALIDYCYEKLSAIQALQFLVDEKPDVPLFSFNLDNHHQQDLAVALDAKGIAIRAGHHCAMPLMEYLNIPGCIRLSLACYNTFEEIDVFVNALLFIIKESEIVSDFSGKSLKSPLNSSNISKVESVDKVKVPHQNIEISSDVHENHANVLPSSDALITLFSHAKSWDAKHREIMLLGKSLLRMDKAFRSESTLIDGCESKAWIKIQHHQNGLFSFEADSDAKVIRGLLVIVLAAYNDKSAMEINAFNIELYFSELGLLKHLSPSRGNGLLAIVKKIQQAVL